MPLAKAGETLLKTNKQTPMCSFFTSNNFLYFIGSFKEIVDCTSQCQWLSSHMNYVAMEHESLDVTGLSDLYWHTCNQRELLNLYASYLNGK